jgi:hypothetical protein
MNTPRTLTRIIAGALLSGGVAVTGLGLAAGTARADAGNDHCSTRSGCYKGPGMRWCPGDYVFPDLAAVGWDMSVCHVYHSACTSATLQSCPDPNAIVEGPPPPPAPPIFHTKEECMQALGFLCVFAPG